MPSKRSKSIWKHLLKAIIGVLIFSILAVLMLPFYWGWLLGLVIQKTGATYDKYERISYSRFAFELTEIQIDGGGSTTVIQSKRIEAPMPAHFIFAWDRNIQVEGWTVAHKPTSERIENTTPTSLLEIVNKGIQSYQQFSPFIQSLKLKDGLITSGNGSISISNILIQNDQLFVSGDWEERNYSFAGKASLEDSNNIPLTIKLPDLESGISFRCVANEETFSINGEINYKKQPLQFSAQWNDSGLLPEEAKLSGNDISIFAPILKDYSLSETVTASIDLFWAAEKWNADLKMQASSKRSAEAIDLDAQLKLHGDMDRVTISELTLISEGIEAELASKLEINMSHFSIPEDATFTFKSNLSEQSFFQLKGTAEGIAKFRKSTQDSYPEVEFKITGEQLQHEKLQIETLQMQALLQWPELRIQQAAIKLDSASYIDATGAIDFNNKTFESLNLNATFTSEWPERLFKELPSFEKAEAQLLVQGKWAEPKHTGKIEITDLELKPANKVNMTLSWEAIATNFSHLAFDALLPSYDTRIQGTGSFIYRNSNEALAFTASGVATHTIESEEPISLYFESKADTEGIQLEQIKLTQGSNDVFQANGFFPLHIYPNAKEPLRLIAPKLPFSFKLNTLSSGRAMEKLFAIWNWKVLEPELNAELEGSLDALLGRVDIKARKVTPPAETVQSLKSGQDLGFDSLQATALFNESGVRIESFIAYVLGKEIQTEAFLPLGEEGWRNLIEQHSLPDVSNASASVSIEVIPLATLGSVLPAMLRPEGTVSGSLNLEPGKRLTAQISLRDGATRPLPPFGALRQIEADLKVENRVVTIQQLAASISDKPITVEGSIGLANPSEPRLDLQLKGDSLPLARTSGVVLRGSPDLRIFTPDGGVTRIEGSLDLKDSILTVDLADLSLDLSGGSTTDEGVATRFPYFSITEAPFGDWILDIEIDGDAFMNVRTPGFVGRVSADYQIGGTLKEPIAVGYMTVPQGSIRFPFANLIVSKAKVGTSQQEPFLPTIEVTAKGKSYGYEITMEVAGSISDPQVTFSSSPSLSAQAIILLITSGQIPNTEFGKSKNQRLSGLGFYFSKSLLADLGWLDPSEDRLQIRVGEEVSRTGRDTVKLEYQLNEDWSAQGEYDQFDTYNLDLRWKLFEK